MEVIGYGSNGKHPGYRGGACRRKSPMLSGRQHRALVEASRMLIDEIIEDYANMRNGRNLADTKVFVECLPKQFRHRYTESFVKQFLVCSIAVSGRLAYWDSEEIAHSTGECLALYAILEKATLFLTLEDSEMGKLEEEDADLDFRDFESLAFVDGEYAFLFDYSLQDIAEKEVVDCKNVPLELEDWFIPSYEDPAHPYLSVQDAPHREESQCSGHRSVQANDDLIVAKVASGY